MLKKQLFALAMGVGLFLLPALGWAVPYKLTNETPLPSQPGYIHVGANSSPDVYIGEYHGTFTPTVGPAYLNEAILCFDPLVIGSATIYNRVPLASVLGNAVANHIGALMANAPDGTTVLTSAALEAAALELSYDPSPSDVTSGYLHITGFTAAEIALANSYVANVLGNVWTLPTDILPIAWTPVDGQSGQRFASIDVSEPSTVAILGISLLGIGLVNRRHSA